MNYRRILSMATVGLFATVMSISCSHSDRKAPADSDTAVVAYRMADEYVAENDIAMTVRSIVDAISVGEMLDTAEYNYNGILTDGEGVPLYTDIQGNPGEWEVDVLNENSVRIHNLYLGDLLPKDLMEYLTAALSLSESNLCASDEYEDDDETHLEVYDFGSGSIRFETREAFAPNGLEGPLMSIVITDETTKS